MCLRQVFTISEHRRLSALVAVADDIGRLALADCHLQRCQYQLGPQMLTSRVPQRARAPQRIPCEAGTIGQQCGATIDCKGLSMRLTVPVFILVAASVALAGCGMFRESAAPRSQVTLRVADAALASGAPDVALRVADIVLQKDLNNVAALVAKGDALYAMGARDMARTAYRAAVVADPTDVAAQIGLGRTLVRSDSHGAEVAFRAAVARQPDNVVALNDLGIALDLQGHHDEAQKAYRQALAFAPEAPDVQANLGLSLALSGEGAKTVQLPQPIAATPEASPLKRADPTIATAPARSTGAVEHVQEQAAHLATAPYDTPQIEIGPAPVAIVRGQDLPIQSIKDATPEADARPARLATPPAQISPPVEGFYVQVASLDSEQAARTEWQRLRTRWPDLLADRAPTVIPADVHDRKFWRLRTGGFPSVSDAKDFCSKLRTAGSGCWVVATVSHD